MSRRILLCLGALVGLIALVASTGTASAQIPDFSDLFAGIINSLPLFIRSFVSAIFQAIVNGFCVFFGNCAS